MYAWPKFHGSSPYSFWENDLYAKTWKKSVNSKKQVKNQNWTKGWPLLKMNAWPKFHGSSPYSFWENDLKARTRQKSVNRKKSITKTEHRVDLYSSRYLHDSSPYSFWEYDLTQKLDKSQWTVKRRSRLEIECRVDLYSSRCMHDPSFMALAFIVSEKMT